MYGKHKEDGLILAMTASPGNDVSKIFEVCKNLNIKNIEIRSKYDYSGYFEKAIANWGVS